MKIITDNVAYVQKNDIAYLNASDLPIPESIFMKVFGNGVVIIDDSNRYDFIKFEEKSEIEFFQGIDWMIDFNEVKDLPEEEIILLAQSIAEELEETAKKYNAMPPTKKEKHRELIQKCKLLEFKFFSLRDILWLKQGHISMESLEELGYFNRKKETGLKRLLKRKKNEKKC